MKNLKNPNSVTVKFRLGAPGQKPKTQQITNTSDWLIDLESNLLFYFSIYPNPSKVLRNIQLFILWHTVEEILATLKLYCCTHWYF